MRIKVTSLNKLFGLALIFFLISIIFEIQISQLVDYNTSGEVEDDIVQLTSESVFPDKIQELSTDIVSPGANTRAPSNVLYWATFQFDYHNTGNTSSKAPDSNNTLWTFKTKGEIFSSPMVVNNSVYFTSTDGFLYCVDLTTGQESWKYDLMQMSYATPTIFNGYVYVGSGSETQNNANRLFCVNGANGKASWSKEINGPTIGSPLVIDRPGISEDRVYFATLMDNKIYSYDPLLKTFEWEFVIPNGGNGASDGIWGSMAFYNFEGGWILFASNSESDEVSISRGLFCLNSYDGSLRWQFPEDLDGDPIKAYSSPTIFQDKVLIGTGTTGQNKFGKLYCLDINTGNVLWNYSTGGGASGYGITTSPVVANNKIFFGACDGKFYALDFNGNQLWNFTTGDSDDGIYSSPSIADGKVYFGSSDKVFYCLNVNNGSLIWKYDTSNDDESGYGLYGVSSAPAIAYNKVLVGACNGYLYCFGSTGSEPPSISINSPADNSMVKGSVEIRGEASDDVEVTSVQIKIDDGNWINLTGKYSWSHIWDTTSVNNGPHTIFARAFDKTGFFMTNITLIVNNGENELLLVMTSHINGQIVSGITKFAGTAYSSKDPIIEVHVNIDNETIWHPIDGTSVWHYYWDTTEFTDGEYYIQFRAFDGMNYSDPVGIMINVINEIPHSYEITPMFRGNRNRIGVYGSTVPNSTKIIWNFTTDNQVESSAIYYNGRIYFGSDDYFIYCLDADPSDGKDEGISDDPDVNYDIIWKYETANQVRSTPVIANKQLYVGSNDYYLYCINAQSGELVWRNRTGGAIDTSPLVLNNSVYVGSRDGKLYMFNATNGKKLKNFKTEDEIWGSPAFGNKCIYFGSLDGKLYCLWSNNLTQRWNFSTNLKVEPHGIYSTPAVIDDRVIFGGEDNFVYCVNSFTSELIWKFKTTGYIYSSAAVNKGVIYITSLEAENDGVLYALPLNDPNTDGLITSFEVIWTYQTHDFDGGSSPAVSTLSGKVIIGSNAGKSGGIGRLYCLDEVTGELDWMVTVDGDIHGSPLIADDKIYLGSLDGNMYCFGFNDTSGGNGNGNGNGGSQNETQIIVEITIPATEVLSGHSIENITISALTESGTPIKNAKLDFLVTKGTLSDYTGTILHCTECEKRKNHNINSYCIFQGKRILERIKIRHNHR
jgi:outer membrane protein assembly factor BamB